MNTRTTELEASTGLEEAGDSEGIKVVAQVVREPSGDRPRWFGRTNEDCPVLQHLQHWLRVGSDNPEQRGFSKVSHPVQVSDSE